MTDDLALRSAWLFQNKKKKQIVQFWAPDPIFYHSTDTYYPSWWVLIKDVQDSCTKWYKHTHGWRLNCGAALTVLGYLEDREGVLYLAAYSRFPFYTVILQTFSCLQKNSDSWGQSLLDTTFLNLNSTHHLMFWSTVMQKATYKLQIHIREWSLTYGEPRLFRSA